MKGDGGRDEVATVATSAASTPPPAEAAMAELLTRIMSMDPREAHRQMCLAQDEVARLQRQARQEPPGDGAESGRAVEAESGEGEARSRHAREVADPSPDDGGMRTPNAARSPSPTSTRKQRSVDRHVTAGGTWLASPGEKLCAEFLPNVGRLQLTLTGLAGTSPKEEGSANPHEGLELDVSNGRLRLASSVREDRRALLEVELPKTLSELVVADGARVSSVDSDSISIRMQLPLGRDGADLAEDLVGGRAAIPPWISTRRPYASCPGWSSRTTQFWCCTGPTLGTEDSVNVGGRAKGYGEHSLGRGNNEVTSTMEWRDGGSSATGSAIARPLACSRCLSTLGYAAGDDGDTCRLYKHLLDCGGDQSTPTPTRTPDDALAAHTVGSFLAGEMVRNAETMAVYTFVVGVSDESDWTRLSGPQTHLLLHILSWDTVMAAWDGGGVVGKKGKAVTVNKGTGDELPPRHSAEFTRAVKVIYEETGEEGGPGPANGDEEGAVWTWRCADFCCPPDNANGPLPPETEAKASAVRIYLSGRERDGLLSQLEGSAGHFPRPISDALVGMKLGPSRGADGARVGFLPLV
ncbi:hypothetical protein THAOC_09992 [Thalassiosira oceanica]|uniref:Uncharacterized protein n=1 Tax=Thalassiosira oceanica TaxID=159749 RepID=K0SV31_THAOC|nr:hypothetical protein THAOC_09992 [Thalassiosira oceanica]|eukprot:EJK68799.1 hypothetical protein THAOC_09992 [Thalassiosira oceanica]